MGRQVGGVANFATEGFRFGADAVFEHDDVVPEFPPSEDLGVGEGSAVAEDVA